MIIRHYIVLILAIGWPVIAFSQQATHKRVHQFNLGAGLQHISTYDQVFSPQTYRGSAGLGTIGYQSTGRVRHRLSLFYNYTIQKPVLNESSESVLRNHNGALHYDVQFPVHSGQWQAFAGGGLHSFTSFRRLEITKGEEIALDWINSLCFTGTLQRKWNGRHFIVGSFSYPLISYVLGSMERPKDVSAELWQAYYDNNLEIPVGKALQSGDWLFAGQLIDVSTSIEYRRIMSAHWQLQLLYRFRYYQCEKWMTVKYGYSQYIVGIIYQL